MKKLVLAALFLGCTPLNEKPYPASYICLPVGWSLVGSDHSGLLLRSGAPTTPTIYWTVGHGDGTGSGVFLIEPGADIRCPITPEKQSPHEPPDHPGRWR